MRDVHLVKLVVPRRTGTAVRAEIQRTGVPGLLRCVFVWCRWWLWRCYGARPGGPGQEFVEDHNG